MSFKLLPDLPDLTYQSKHKHGEEKVDQQWTIIPLKALVVLHGPKKKYLHLAAKRYNYKTCNKGFPSIRALFSHMHPHKVLPTQLQPLPPSVRNTSTTLNFILGCNSNMEKSRLTNN
ncbi:unnamed protein product [Prunus armeniaca]|uniref:C2H2-type domain-containing protein n=1 Tax=Prunus armeniaca TaxID=36596 RepID=A0A6J5XT72_PRUAR|nr:unnamed protein product [Prunus armeniaca]